MRETDPLVAAGKEQGEIIAAYLIRRMQAGTITPIEAVNVGIHARRVGAGSRRRRQALQGL